MYHNPVLLEESIIGLNINPNGTYVDATFGGGGHSTEILNKLNSSGRIIAFDQDQDAIDNKILDNSPPEAILNNGAYSIPLLAENKTSI